MECSSVVVSLNTNICKHYRSEEWNSLHWKSTQEIQISHYRRFTKRSIKPQTSASHCLAASPPERQVKSIHHVHTQKVNDYIFSPKTCLNKNDLALFWVWQDYYLSSIQGKKEVGHHHHLKQIVGTTIQKQAHKAGFNAQGPSCPG